MAVFALLFWGIWYGFVTLKVMNGYAAKHLCSCYYLQNRTVEDISNAELAKYKDIVSLGIDSNTNTAFSSVFGLAKKKAVYRPGLGCTLISEGIIPATEKEVILPAGYEAYKNKEWPLGYANANCDTFSHVNYAQLDKALDWAFTEPETGKYKTKAIIVVHKGKIIAERYIDGYDTAMVQLSWSMAKSVASTLIGTLVEQDELNLSRPAPIEQWQEDDTKKHITLDQILTMQTGLYADEDYSKYSEATRMLFLEADMAQHAMNQAVEHNPGTHWYYSSATTNLLTYILKTTLEAAGEDALNYPRTHLFEPLGMHTAVFETDVFNTFVGSSYLYACPRDWAKFGMLYLNKGTFNGQQLLSEHWVNYVQKPAEHAPMQQYGAQFWLNKGEKEDPTNRLWPDAPLDTYSCNGFQGQHVTIVPSSDLVVVRFGLSEPSHNFNQGLFVKKVVNCIE